MTLEKTIMSERKIRELNYKFQVGNVKLMSAERSGDFQING